MCPPGDGPEPSILKRLPLCLNRILNVLRVEMVGLALVVLQALRAMAVEG